MNDKELYQKKMQARLDEWQADVEKLKARASQASADVQIEMNKHIRKLDKKLEEGKTKLSEINKSGGEAWTSLKDGMESAWDSLKSGVNDAVSKFKK